MNFCAPSTPWLFHGLDASSGPINISYSLNVSAPKSFTILLGSTTNSGYLFPILIPFEPKIIPWWTSFLNGSFTGDNPLSYK